MLKADRDQLCAEAICAFLSYEPWHITGQAAESQELAAGKRSEEDPRAWVLGLLGDVSFSARRVLDLLGNEKDDHDKADAQRVGGMCSRVPSGRKKASSRLAAKGEANKDQGAHGYGIEITSRDVRGVKGLRVNRHVTRPASWGGHVVRNT